MRDDRGSIVIGWLTKLALVLAILGAIGFEMVSLGLARLSVQDVANDAAREASQTYRESRNVQLAYVAAVAVATEHDATIRPEDFRVTPDGTVTLTAHKTATTTFVHRFGATKDWVDAKADAKARFAS